ncbi:MAG: hypothetical protein V7L04_13420 [Nostoc sp.]|uniref:hypothetical protein n=1 Tax=Nostoc sp. TaxID=1180 RepID=UPI002FFAE40A
MKIASTVSDGRERLVITFLDPTSVKNPIYQKLRNPDYTIDVKGDGFANAKADRHPKFIVRFLLAEWHQRQWHNSELEPIII